MKPFDLEAAKRGEPITTRDGRNVRFVGHVPEASENCRVVAFVAGETCVQLYADDGKYVPGIEDRHDLFMATRTVYVNLYEDGCAAWHETEASASSAAAMSPGEPLHTAVPVEI